MIALLKILLALGTGVCLIIGVKYVGDYFAYSDKASYLVDSTWIRTVGSLTQIRRIGKGGSSSYFDYEVDGLHYNLDSYEQYDISGSTKGEKCVLMVNPKRPEVYIPVSSQPIFTDDEVTYTTVGRVVDFRKHESFLYKRKTNVVFVYEVQNIQFKREQELSLSYKDTYSNLGINGKFEVEYWGDDPQRAIIHLDKPSNE